MHVKANQIPIQASLVSFLLIVIGGFCALSISLQCSLSRSTSFLNCFVRKNLFSTGRQLSSLSSALISPVRNLASHLQKVASPGAESR